MGQGRGERIVSRGASGSLFSCKNHDLSENRNQPLLCALRRAHRWSGRWEITRLLPGVQAESFHKQTRGWSCLPPFPALCTATPRVPSALLCYTLAGAKVQPRTEDPCCHVPA